MSKFIGTVHPRPAAPQAPNDQAPGLPQGSPNGDPWSGAITDPNAQPQPGATAAAPGPTPAATPSAPPILAPADTSSAQPPAASAGAPTDPWAGALSAEPPKSTKPDRVVGTGEAIATGALDSLTFGAAPAMAGVAAAAEAAEPQSGPLSVPAVAPFGGAPSVEPGAEAGPGIVGLVRALGNAFSSHPDPKVVDAYNQGRTDALAGQQAAQQQHPAAYIGGQLAGALALPVGGAATGASTAARIGGAVVGGAIAGGAYGAGSSVSEGDDLPTTAVNTVEGAGTGALFGLGGGAGAELGGKLVSKGISLFRGAKSDASARVEAARQILSSISADHAAAADAGRSIRLDPAAIREGSAAGTLPGAIVDAGGERTRALFRSSANLSPEARQAAEDFTQARFRNQSGRVAPYVRDLAGGMSAGDDVARLQAAARKVNRPLYARAYAAGDRPLYSPRLEQLMGSDALPAAINGAVQRGRNRAALDGFGALNPKVQITADGRVVFPRDGKGIPAYPNLQFWDYAQRELRDMADAARRSGRNEEASAIGGIHHAVLEELDKLVPEFGNARGVAARFFGAADAHEAGAEFVSRNVDWREARSLLQKMSPPERELFARGFASRLADEIEKSGDRSNVLDSIFLNSPAARRKIVMALGPDRADKLEALLRAETLVDKARKALGNSTTARQLRELGMSAGHGVGAGATVLGLEEMREGGIEPAHVVAAALIAGAARHGAHVIDDRVARHIGELLVSRDPDELMKGLAIVTRKPVLFNALRRATAGTAYVGAHDVGARKAAAAGLAVVQAGLGNGGEAAHPFDAITDQVGQ